MKTLFFSLIGLFLFNSLVAQESKAPLNTKVTNMAGEPQPGETIIFKAKSSGLEIKGVADENGAFKVELPGGNTYEIIISSIGEDQDYSEITIPTLGPNQSYGEYQLEVKFEYPRTITLDNVLFDTDKASLRKESYKELNELYELMARKEKMTIEIAGHTDSQGDDQYNLNLSQQRANTVKNYLVKKGIDGSRVRAVGYGESQPVADNSSAAGRQQNRRTEVRILSR